MLSLAVAATVTVVAPTRAPLPSRISSMVWPGTPEMTSIDWLLRVKVATFSSLERTDWNCAPVTLMVVCAPPAATACLSGVQSEPQLANQKLTGPPPEPEPPPHPP